MGRFLLLMAASWTLGCASPVAQEPITPPVTRPAPYVQTEETAIRNDRVRQILGEQMRRCWQMPTDLPNPERLIVTVAFELNPDGTLRGQPRVVDPRNYAFDADMRTAVERALRAVRACAPYPFPNDEIVGQHYETWDALQMRFRAYSN